MSASISGFTRSLSALSLSIVYPALATGQSICTTLDSEADRGVCEETIASRSWLTSVQKVSTGSAVPDLSASSGILYIFDSNSTDGVQAVYNLPAIVNVKGDSAVVGNGGREAKPRLLLNATESSSRMETSEPGRYLFADVEIRTQTSNDSNQRVLQSHGPDHLELSGVTLSADYLPPNGSGQTYLLYMLHFQGNSSQVNSTAVFDIHDCEFQMPDVSSSTEASFLLAAFIGTSPPATEGSVYEGGTTRGRYSNNRIVTRTYNNTRQKVQALEVIGNVDLDKDSNCNSVVNPSGQDLLGKNGNELFVTQVISPTKNGAFGFNNRYAWGWKLNHDEAQTLYDTWDNWKKLGVDTECNDTSSGSNLAVKIAVPIVVVGVVLVLTAAGLIVGYKKIPKKSWQELSSMVERGFMRLRHKRFRNVPTVEGEL